MANPVTIVSSTSASKRARSQNSQCLSNNLPASGTTAIIQASYSPNIPAFLRQSRSGLFITAQVDNAVANHRQIYALSSNR